MVPRGASGPGQRAGAHEDTFGAAPVSQALQGPRNSFTQRTKPLQGRSFEAQTMHHRLNEICTRI